LNCPIPVFPCGLSKNCSGALNARLRLGMLWEPPGADPHAGWCGGWGRKSPGYPLTPGMGVNLWGESPLYVNPASVLCTFAQVLAEGKGGTARDRPEEAGVQSE
jgi:hypothetical protein